DFDEVSDLKHIAVAFALIILLLFLGSVFVAFVQGIPLRQAVHDTTLRIILSESERELPESLGLGVFYLLLTFFAVGTTYYLMKSIVGWIVHGGLTEAINMAKINKLSNHYIICGAGRVGSRIAARLKEEKKPFVIIEEDYKKIREMERVFKYPVVEGDAMEEFSLIKAGIRKAKFFYAVLGRGEDNLFLVLEAKELNPDILVYARADNERMMRKLLAAGADQVVMPELSGADELIKASMKEKT
ncbi:MAG: hypothetical protein GOU97_05070, partial [Nanoarchaeota archaeon]|nr:hypothetical protein [Nanoarchaeota archaeon]